MKPATPLLILSLAAASLLSACASDPGPSRSPLPPLLDPSAEPGGSPRPWTPDPEALLPERIRIHPLTRVARDPAGETQLAVHLELKDRFGHNIKTLGWLRIELTGARQEGINDADPSGDTDSDDGRARNVYWEVDLRDPDQNALMYDDLISRTYLINLGGLPGWVGAWSAGEPGASADPWLNLHATFVAHDSEGNERVLRTSHRLER